jgi:hypothetical protein
MIEYHRDLYVGKGKGRNRNEIRVIDIQRFAEPGSGNQWKGSKNNKF